MTPKNFPEALEFYSKMTGISLRKVARLIGLPEATPGHWKRRRNLPTFAQAEAACEALGLTGSDAALFLDLATIEQIPDDGYRDRMLGIYLGFKSFEGRLKAPK